MSVALAPIAAAGHAAGELEGCHYAGGHALAAWALGRILAAQGKPAPARIAALDGYHLEADGQTFEFHELGGPEQIVALVEIDRFGAPVT